MNIVQKDVVNTTKSTAQTTLKFLLSGISGIGVRDQMESLSGMKWNGCPESMESLSGMGWNMHFVTNIFAETAKEWALRKKGNSLIEKLAFDEMADGKCIQMMHLGRYDDEPESFATMEEFCTKTQLKRKSKQHKEIYISDPRKVVPEKLKTVLRFEVE